MRLAVNMHSRRGGDCRIVESSNTKKKGIKSTIKYQSDWECRTYGTKNVKMDMRFVARRMRSAVKAPFLVCGLRRCLRTTPSSQLLTMNPP